MLEDSKETQDVLVEAGQKFGESLKEGFKEGLDAIKDITGVDLKNFGKNIGKNISGLFSGGGGVSQSQPTMGIGAFNAGLEEAMVTNQSLNTTVKSTTQEMGGLGAAMTKLTNKLKDSKSGFGHFFNAVTSSLGDFGQIVNSTLQGFAATGSPMGAFIAFLIEIAKRTKGFKKTIDGLMKIVDGLVDIVSVFSNIVAELNPVFEAIGELFSSLAGALEGLLEIIRAVVGGLAKVAGGLIKGVAKVIDGIFYPLKKLFEKADPELVHQDEFMGVQIIDGYVSSLGDSLERLKQTFDVHAKDLEKAMTLSFSDIADLNIEQFFKDIGFKPTNDNMEKVAEDFFGEYGGGTFAQALEGVTDEQIKKWVSDLDGEENPIISQENMKIFRDMLNESLFGDIESFLTRVGLGGLAAEIDMMEFKKKLGIDSGAMAEAEEITIGFTDRIKSITGNIYLANQDILAALQGLKSQTISEFQEKLAELAASPGDFEAAQKGLISEYDILFSVLDTQISMYDKLMEKQEEQADIIEKVNEQLTNIPSGFKIALARFQAQDADVIFDRDGGQTRIYVNRLDVNEASNVDQITQQLTELADWNSYTNTASTAGSNMPGAVPVVGG